MGLPGYEIATGRVLLDYVDLAGPYKGVAFAFQIPPRLHGVRVGVLLSHIYKKMSCDAGEIAKVVEIEHLLDREVGMLYGGESKRVRLHRHTQIPPRSGAAPCGELGESNCRAL